MRAPAIAALAALVFAAPAAGQAPRWVAPVYPGSVEAGDQGVFLTGDRAENVVAFYAGRLGPGTTAGRTDRWVAPYAHTREGDIYWLVVSFDEARAITGETLNENMSTTAAGVLVRGLYPEARIDPDRPGELRAVGGYYDRLETMARLGSVERAPARALMQKYLHLARRHYPRVEWPRGRWVPLYDEQTDRCGETILTGVVATTGAPPAEETVDAMTARMEALIAEGKVQEAMQLQQRVMELAMGGAMAEAAAEAEEDGLPTMGSAEVLQRFEACLQELEKQSYSTLITISTHPSQWPRD